LLLSPLGKGISPLFEKKIESPRSKDALCQVWLKLDSGSGDEVKNVKVYRQTDRRRTTGDQKTSLELSAQESYKFREEDEKVIFLIYEGQIMIERPAYCFT
jgi:hypothetical protein